MTDAAPALEVRAVTHRHGPALALDEVSLAVPAGEVHGLLGPNGAGKTTLLGVVLGLLVADRGDVRRLGAATVPDGALPDGVAGFVETPRFWPSLTGLATLDALRALDGPAGSAGLATPELLDRVGLADAARRPVGHYSLGMRQRLAIAAALLRRPRLLVLDEPTGGLDPTGLDLLHQVVRDLAASGCAVLLSSHDLVECEDLCDAVSVLRSGRVVWQGTVSQARDEAPAPSYVIRTTDDAHAAHLLSRDPDLDVRRQTGGLLVSGEQGAVDAAVAAMAVAGGPAIRELRLATPPLAALFERLTA